MARGMKQLWNSNTIIPLCYKGMTTHTRWTMKTLMYSADVKQIRRDSGFMKAWQTNSYGGLENIELQEVSIPLLKHPKDVLIQVSASSLNPIDVAMIGGYGQKMLNAARLFDKMPWGHLSCSTKTLPLTVGRDFTGEVVGTGKSVTELSVGDKVWGVSDFTRQGSHAEHVLTNSSNVCHMPESVSNTDCASLPFVALTGWSTLTLTGMINKSNAHQKSVLILGAAGGVGSFLCQILKFWGAEVVAVCGVNAFERLNSYGVSEVYDYKDINTETTLLSDARFDLIIDAANQPDLKWMKALRSGVGASFISLMGPLLRNIDDNGLALGLGMSLGQLVKRNVCALSENKFYKWGYFMPNQRALKEVTQLVEDRHVLPYVDQVYPFLEAPTAYSHQATGKPKGKIILDHLSQ